LANILGNLKVRIRQNYGNVKHQEKT
jgi:hypothetical protein